MTEAIWGDATKTPSIDWTVSASLENVQREGQDIIEVTNLDGAVRAWLSLDPAHQKSAILTVEHGVQRDGVTTSHF